MLKVVVHQCLHKNGHAHVKKKYISDHTKNARNTNICEEQLSFEHHYIFTFVEENIPHVPSGYAFSSIMNSDVGADNQVVEIWYALYLLSFEHFF